MASTVYAYLGSWDRQKSKSRDAMLVCRYDAETGALTELGSGAPGITVGQTYVDEARRVLYCVDEDTTHSRYYRGGGGLVYAFAVDPESGSLTALSRQPSYGALPTHLTADATGKYLVLTHHTSRDPVTLLEPDGASGYRIVLVYDQTNTVLFPLSDDGSIGDPCDVFVHEGDGGPLPIQTHPQLHSIAMAPSGRFFVLCDKADDRIVVLRIDEREHKLVAVNGAGYPTEPGTSVRYSVFHL